MISATRRWLRRNRTGIAVGAGLVGATYLAGQYVLGKINETRERMQLDRIAKEKYCTLHPFLIYQPDRSTIVFEDDSSKTRPTVRLPSLHCCLP